MKKWFKAGLMMALGLALVIPSATTSANAASKKVTIVSTKTIAQTAYHGKKGYIYSSAKLTKKSHHMTNYKYTTWYGTKKATIKKSGKKSSLTYITSGKKHGWIYSKYLTVGKAPINKAKLRQNDIVAYNRAVMFASSGVQEVAKASLTSTYKSVGDNLSYAWGGDWYSYSSSVEISTTKMDQASLLKVYNIFKGRFTTSQNANLATMAADLDKQQVTTDSIDLIRSKMGNLAGTLGDLLSNLD